MYKYICVYICVYIYIAIHYRFIGHQHVLCLARAASERSRRPRNSGHSWAPTTPARRKRHSRESMAELKQNVDPEVWGTDAKIHGKFHGKLEV